MNKINVKTFYLGMWQTSCYVVSAEGAEKCWIIDAGFEPERMVAYIKSENLNPELLIYTHTHLDHIAGTKVIKKAFPEIKTAVSDAEANFPGNPELNLSSLMGMNMTADEADIILTDGQLLVFCGFGFQVIATPGHSPGGICLYQKESRILFSGDTLFQGSIGRYDFPTSDGPKLFDSINNRLMPLPPETRVFPGHGPATTIGDEKKSNPFLRG